jgi:CheY-like chemotaxis protein
MDVQMPEMDGLAATAAIRKKEQNTGRHQLIIALTAHAMKSDRDRCLDAGMDGFLTKPIRIPDFYAALSQVESAIVPFVPKNQDVTGQEQTGYR